MTLGTVHRSLCRVSYSAKISKKGKRKPHQWATDGVGVVILRRLSYSKILSICSYPLGVNIVLYFIQSFL